ncbi:hypothetical protein [Lysobacter sp. CA196]|uniref:hypothetical protein n=1 Tax=Lysobacter sp. CA196 TaxID=3455606 RepID=UPI003F8D7003
MPRPTYYPSGFGAEAVEAVEVDAPEEISISIDRDDSVPSTQFIEVVSFAATATSIRFLSLLDTDGNPHEIPADIALKPGGHFDLEMTAKVGVRQLKVVCEDAGVLKTAYADFTAVGHASFRYGSVLWDGLSESIPWMGQADFADDVAHSGINVPQVVVEQNPAPEFPDVFCGTPMRLRNLEPYRVHVRYSQAFWNEGAVHICDPTRVLEEMECTLAPQGVLPLGCSHYRTPNMLCSWNKRWCVTGAIQVL